MSGRALQKWLQLVFTFKASRLTLGILGESLSKSVKDDLKVNKSKDVRIQVLIDSRPNLFCKLRQIFLLCVKFGEVVLLVGQKRYVPEARALCERKELLLR